MGRGGRGNGILQVETYTLQAFPWTTNEQQIYIRLQVKS